MIAPRPPRSWLDLPRWVWAVIVLAWPALIAWIFGE